MSIPPTNLPRGCPPVIRAPSAGLTHGCRLHAVGVCIHMLILASLGVTTSVIPSG